MLTKKYETYIGDIPVESNLLRTLSRAKLPAHKQASPNTYKMKQTDY